MYKIGVYAAALVWLLCGVSVLCACTGKAPVDKDLEVFWQQEHVADEATGQQTECNRIYWSVQLGLVEFNDYGGNGYPSLLCQYEYDKSARTLHLHQFRLRSNQMSEPTLQALAGYGITALDVVYEVVTLDKDVMVLRGGGKTLYFRSF